MLEFMKLDARPKMSYWGKGHSLMLLALGRVSDLKNFVVVVVFFFANFTLENC